MGSLGSRLRPPVPSTSRADVQMLRLDQTVVMEVRGRQMELQTKKVDYPKNKQPRRVRRKQTGGRVDPGQPGTSVEATANHISSSGPDHRRSEESGTCVRQNELDAADNVQSSEEDRETCTTKMTNTETVIINNR